MNGLAAGAAADAAPAASSSAGRAWRVRMLVFAIGAAGYAGIALRAGQDANWDLLNYHDYVAYALLHWRYPIDGAPGVIQSYLNPLPYVLPYLLRHHAAPMLAAAGIAVSQATLVPLLWELAGALLPRQRDAAVTWTRALATAAGATGGLTLSEVGTSFAGLILALPTLAALLLLVRAADEPAAPPRQAGLEVAAGVCGGIAIGLKLTNLPIQAALGLAALLPAGRCGPPCATRWPPS